MPSSRRKFFKILGISAVTSPFLSLPAVRTSRAYALDEFESNLRQHNPGDERFWKLVRDQFPLTKDRAFFNTGGLGASPYQVINAVKKRMDELEEVSEVGRSTQVWNGVKAAVARFIDCEPGEVTLTGCCTEGMNIAANSIALQPGDEVLTTTHEHVGGALPWLGLQKRRGIVVKTFEPGHTAGETLDRMKRAVTEKTRVISVSHVTCTTGAILPAKEISDYARQQNIWSVIDGAQAVGNILVSVSDIGCDIYATSGHKWMLGPKRTGILFVKKDRIDEMLPVTIGAYSDEYWDFNEGVILHPTAQRFEYGTYNVPLMVGLQSAVEFLERIGMASIYTYTQQLAAMYISEIKNLPNVELLSPAREPDVSSMITIRLKNMENTALQSFLASEYNLRTRIVPEAGLDGLRVSLHVYNNREEVHRLINGVRKASTKL